MARNEIFDFYKALLMFGVVWGHTITHFGGGGISCNVTWLLRLYDMPFFMLISGYFLRRSMQKYNYRHLLLSKVTTILFPTVLWSLIISRGTSILGYYFLYAVFLSSVIIVLVEEFANKTVIKYLLYFLLISLLYLIDYKPFNLCYLFPFFLFGFKTDIWQTNYKMLCFCLFLISICFWNDSFVIWKADTNILHGYKVLGVNIYRLSIGIVGVVTMKMVFDMLYDYFKKRYPSQLSLISETIGKETLGIYIFHVFIVTILLKNLVKLLNSKLGYNPFLVNEKFLVFFITPLFTILALFISYKFVSICKKNQFFKFLWGVRINNIFKLSRNE